MEMVEGENCKHSRYFDNNMSKFCEMTKVTKVSMLLAFACTADVGAK